VFRHGGFPNRSLGTRKARVEVWAKRIAVAAELPTVPLWIDVDICVPLPLEPSYTAACYTPRIAS
jgi:hypothetical protein